MLLVLLLAIATTQPQTLEPDEIAVGVGASIGALAGGAAGVAWVASGDRLDHALLAITLSAGAGGAVGAALAAVFVGRAWDAPLVGALAAVGVPRCLYSFYRSSWPLFLVFAEATLWLEFGVATDVAFGVAVASGVTALVLGSVVAVGGAGAGAIAGLKAADEFAARDEDEIKAERTSDAR